MGKLLLVFTIVPLVELYLLIYLGGVIGFWPTVAIVLVTGLLGATLAKHEGLRVLSSYREALSEGRMPEEGVLGGLLVLVGGIFLVTPGILTDLTGLCLLFPPTRRLVAARVRRYVERRIQQGSVHVVSYGVGGVAGPFDVGPFGDNRASAPEPGVIDVEGEVVEVDTSDRNAPNRLTK